MIQTQINFDENKIKTNNYNNNSDLRYPKISSNPLTTRSKKIKYLGIKMVSISQNNKISNKNKYSFTTLQDPKNLTYNLKYVIIF